MRSVLDVNVTNRAVTSVSPHVSATYLAGLLDSSPRLSKHVSLRKDVERK